MKRRNREFKEKKSGSKRRKLRSRFTASPLFNRNSNYRIVEKSNVVIPPLSENTFVPRQSVNQLNLSEVLRTPRNSSFQENTQSNISENRPENISGTYSRNSYSLSLSESSRTTATESSSSSNSNIQTVEEEFSHGDVIGEEEESEEEEGEEEERYQQTNNGSLHTGFPEDMIEKYFPNSCLSRKYPSAETNRNYRNFDHFSNFIKSNSQEKIIQDARSRIIANNNKLLTLYGFCSCCSRKKLLLEVRNILVYEKIDLSFLDSNKYTKPIWVDPQDEARKSSVLVKDVALLYIFLTGANIVSKEAASTSLKIWRGILESDKGILGDGRNVKVNIPLTYSGLVNDIDYILDQKQVLVVFCISCKTNIHVFLKPDNQEKYQKDNIPVCPHCYPGTISIENRKKYSPFRLLRDGSIAAKDGHYVILSNHTHICIDLLKSNIDLLKSVLESSAEFSSILFQTSHGNAVKKEFRDEEEMEENTKDLFIFSNLRIDDILSYNTSATGRKTGIMSIQYPQFEKFMNKFRFIVTTGIAANKSSSQNWKNRVIMNFYFVQFMIYSYKYPSSIVIRNEFSDFSKYRIRFVMNAKQSDLSDIYDSDKIKNSGCSNCRVYPNELTIGTGKNDKNGNEINTKRKLFNIEAGLERSVYTLIEGWFLDMEPLSGFSEYRRGMKGINPFVELAILYCFDYLKSNNQDILHRVSNMFKDLKPILEDSFLEKCEKLVERNVAFHGIPRLLRTFKSLGSIKHTEKLDFLSFISTELMILFEEKPQTVIFYILIRKAFRMLYSKELNIVQWNKIWNMFKDLYVEKFKKFPKCYHHFFVHLLKNVIVNSKVIGEKLVFERILMDILMEQSTESGETYYSEPRKLIRKNSNYDKSLMSSLHYKNYNPILMKEISEEVLGNPIIKKLVNKGLEIKTSSSFNYPLYIDYSHVDELKVTETTYFKDDVLKVLISYVKSLLLNYEGDKIMRERLIRLRKEVVGMEEKLSSEQCIFPEGIVVKRFCKLRRKKYKFDLISKDYTRVFVENMNSNVSYYFPVEELEDDEGNHQTGLEEEYFNFSGRICYFVEISIDNLKRVVSIIQHHKRIGFCYYDRGQFGNYEDFLEDTELVEREGTSLHLIDIKQISNSVLLLGLKLGEERQEIKFDELKIFNLSKNVRKNNRIVTTLSGNDLKNLRIVLKLNDPK